MTVIPSTEILVSPYLQRGRRSMENACRERQLMLGLPVPDCTGCMLQPLCRPVLSGAEPAA